MDMAGLDRGVPTVYEPDPDGDGVAFNGKPIADPATVIDALTHARAHPAAATLGFNFRGGLTETQAQSARDGLLLWDDLIAPNFVEQSKAAVVFVAAGSALSNSSARFVTAQDSDQTGLLHDLGRALGLEQPGGRTQTSYSADAAFFQDSQQYTVMSPFAITETGGAGLDEADVLLTPQTPMLYDIAAVQALYGADTTTRTGDTTYGFNSTADRAVYDFTVNTRPLLTIWDAGGVDTLDLSGSGRFRPVVLNLNEGAFSSGGSLGPTRPGGWDPYPPAMVGNIAIAYGTVIENGRTGPGDDILIGNPVGNVLDAGDGMDTLIGGDGDDTLIGGVSPDVLTGGAGRDHFVYRATNETFDDTFTDFVVGEDLIDVRFGYFDVETGTVLPYRWSETWPEPDGETGRLVPGAVLQYDPETNLTLFMGRSDPYGGPDFMLYVPGQLTYEDFLGVLGG
jgi:serralysin